MNAFGLDLERLTSGKYVRFHTFPNGLQKLNTLGAGGSSYSTSFRGFERFQRSGGLIPREGHPKYVAVPDFRFGSAEFTEC